MSKEWEGGKGDRQRPISNRERFDKNWNEIFGKLDNESTISKGKGQETPTMDERPADRTPTNSS